MGLQWRNGNTFKMMKSLGIFPIIGLLGIFLAEPCLAQELGNWSLGEVNAPDGTTTYTAAIRATNLIVSGGSEPDYAALYTLSCKTGDFAHWKQTLQFEDAISGSGQIYLSVTIDDKPTRDEAWIIGAKNRVLVRENASDISELRSARRFTLKWNWGWSWAWLSDRAQFDLSEIEAVVFTLAKSCGIAEP
jgi:hypothetical protein